MPRGERIATHTSQQPIFALNSAGIRPDEEHWASLLHSARKKKDRKCVQSNNQASQCKSQRPIEQIGNRSTRRLTGVASHAGSGLGQFLALVGHSADALETVVVGSAGFRAGEVALAVQAPTHGLAGGVIAAVTLYTFSRKKSHLINFCQKLTAQYHILYGATENIILKNML